MERSDMIQETRRSPWRSTHCWSCKHPIDSDTDAECPICGWLICHICGACSGARGNCVDTYGFSKEEMEYVRQERRKNPTLSDHDVSALIRRVALDKADREQKEYQEYKKRREEETKRQNDQVKDLMMQIEKGDKVLVGNEGCRFERFVNGEGRIRAYFVLDSGYKQSFYLPDAFVSGRLRFVETPSTPK